MPCNVAKRLKKKRWLQRGKSSFEEEEEKLIKNPQREYLAYLWSSSGESKIKITDVPYVYDRGQKELQTWEKQGDMC